MVCECGHIRHNHQTRRDDWPERHGGQCEGHYDNDILMACSCQSYKKKVRKEIES